MHNSQIELGVRALVTQFATTALSLWQPAPVGACLGISVLYQVHNSFTRVVEYRGNLLTPRIAELRDAHGSIVVLRCFCAACAVATTKDMDSGADFAAYSTRELIGHKKKVYTLGWNCTGKKLASGSQDTTIKIWAVEPAQVSKPERPEIEFKGHVDDVISLVWHPSNPDLLASTSGKKDNTVRFWDCKANKSVAALQTVGENLFLAWSPDGTTLAVGNKENTITFIDCKKFKNLKTVSVKKEINEFLWSPSGKHTFYITGDGAAEVREYSASAKDGNLKSDPVAVLGGHTNSCYCCCISKDGRYFATGGADAVVCLWDLQSMVCYKTIYKTDMPVRSVSYSCDAKYVAVAGEGPGIEIFSTSSGELLKHIEMKLGSDSVAWNPCHNILAYAGDEHQTRDGTFGSVGVFAPPKSS